MNLWEAIWNSWTNDDVVTCQGSEEESLSALFSTGSTLVAPARDHCHSDTSPASSRRLDSRFQLIFLPEAVSALHVSVFCVIGRVFGHKGIVVRR